MADTSNSIGCPLCNTSETAPTPLPTPTQQRFSFIAVPNPLTCAPATLNWSYDGPQEPFTLVISQAHPSKIYPLARMAKGKRDTSSFLIADGLEATDLAFTWPLVNVPSGSYVLQATGTGISVMSPEFFVRVGTNTSCLAVLPPPAPTFASSAPVSTIPTSELFVSTPVYTNTPGEITPLPSVVPFSSSSTVSNTKQTDGIVGGLVGAAVLFAAAFAIYRLRQRRTPVLRLPTFLKRSHERLHWDSGIVSRSPPIVPASPSDQEKADYDRPQPEAMQCAPRAPSTSSISILSDVDELSAATSAADSEIQSQRSLALAALNTNSAGTPARSESEADLGSSIRTQRPRYVHTPAALNLSTPSSSARSRQSSFASGLTVTSPVPSSATSQMYRVRESGRSQWVSVGSPTEGTEAGTVIVQAQRAVVTAGEMRAVRRDFPETPFPMSPDYR
ncbi:hypothetical protein LXA43DRAFT_579926 [Ganoderma leucocontextum]|nr:hypothetical protein LXA43DRAFT_579926 [Ganoderma leucocontextum]